MNNCECTDSGKLNFKNIIASHDSIRNRASPVYRSVQLIKIIVL